MPNGMPDILDIIHPDLQRNVELVCAAVHLPIPKHWGTWEPCGCNGPDCTLRFQMGLAVMTNREIGFVASAESQSGLYTTEEQFGVICHELGHLKYDVPNNNPPSWESEFRADQFAAECGMGRGLLASLYKIAKAVPMVLNASDGEHPPQAERMRRLSNFLNSMKGPAYGNPN